GGSGRMYCTAGCGDDGSVGAPAVAHRLPAHAHTGARVVVVPRGVDGHAGRHTLAHRADVLARPRPETIYRPDKGDEPWSPLRGPTGGADVAVAGGYGGCGRCGVTMADLTPDRLQELRRIAEAATPGPWEWDKSLHLFSATGKPVLTKPFSPDNPDVVEARPEDLDYIERFDPETALALLNRVEQLEADNNKLECENYELYRRIERLEAKLARQRVVLRRLQVAVERHNSQDRIEALRRKLSDEERVLDRIEALERERDAARAEAERWRQQYEALRAGVERILKQIEAAPKPEEFIPTNPDEMMAELLYAMRDGKGHNKGFANGLWVAGMMLR